MQTKIIGIFNPWSPGGTYMVHIKLIFLLTPGLQELRKLIFVGYAPKENIPTFVSEVSFHLVLTPRSPGGSLRVQKMVLFVLIPIFKG